MRRTQYIGLTNEAEAWIQKNCKTHQPQLCDCCGQSLPGEKSGLIKKRYNENYDIISPFPDPPLHEFETLDGRKIRGIVQCSPWSSGPIFFLCLEYVDTQERLFEWSDEDVDAYS